MPPKAWMLLPSSECCSANTLSTISLNTYYVPGLMLEQWGREAEDSPTNNHYTT